MEGYRLLNYFKHKLVQSIKKASSKLAFFMCICSYLGNFVRLWQQRC